MTRRHNFESLCMTMILLPFDKMVINRCSLTLIKWKSQMRRYKRLTFRITNNDSHCNVFGIDGIWLLAKEYKRVHACQIRSLKAITKIERTWMKATRTRSNNLHNHKPQKPTNFWSSLSNNENGKWSWSFHSQGSKSVRDSTWLYRVVQECVRGTYSWTTL